MSEPVVFGSVVEGVKRAFNAQLTPELVASVKALGVDVLAPQPAYPVNVFLPAFLALAEGLVPGASSREARLGTFGRLTTEGFGQTAIGVATLAMARLLGPARTLARAGRNIRNTSNYLEAEAVTRSPTEVHLIARVLPEFQRFITPEWEVMALYRVGVIEGFLGLMSVKAPRVEILAGASDAAKTTFRVAWG